MAKVLIINMDCIMWSCARIYEKYINPNENSTVIWNAIAEDIDIERFISYDAAVLKKIVLIIRDAVARNANFKAFSHFEDAAKYILDRNKNKTDTGLTIISQYYPLHTNPEYEVNTMYSDDNTKHWTEELESMCSTISWIKTPTSHIDTDNAFDNITRYSHKDFDEFSEVLFCNSPKVVPYKYHHLFNIIADAFYGGDDI